MSKRCPNEPLRRYELLQYWLGICIHCSYYDTFDAALQNALDTNLTRFCILDIVTEELTEFPRTGTNLNTRPK